MRTGAAQDQRGAAARLYADTILFVVNREDFDDFEVCGCRRRVT